MANKPVQGYTFDSVGSEHESRNNTTCQIIERAEGDADLMEFGPAFVVEFGDLEQIIAYSSELSPWYQTD